MKTFYPEGQFIELTLDEQKQPRLVVVLRDLDLQSLKDEYPGRETDTSSFVDWLIEEGYLHPVKVIQANLDLRDLTGRGRLWHRQQVMHPSGVLLPPARLIRHLVDGMSVCSLQVIEGGKWVEIAAGVNLYLVHQVIIQYDQQLLALGAHHGAR